MGAYERCIYLAHTHTHRKCGTRLHTTSRMCAVCACVIKSKITGNRLHLFRMATTIHTCRNINVCLNKINGNVKIEQSCACILGQWMCRLDTLDMEIDRMYETQEQTLLNGVFAHFPMERAHQWLAMTVRQVPKARRETHKINEMNNNKLSNNITQNRNDTFFWQTSIRVYNRHKLWQMVFVNIFREMNEATNKIEFIFFTKNMKSIGKKRIKFNVSIPEINHTINFYVEKVKSYIIIITNRRIQSFLLCFFNLRIFMFFSMKKIVKSAQKTHTHNDWRLWIATK